MSGVQIPLAQQTKLVVQTTKCQIKKNGIMKRKRNADEVGKESEKRYSVVAQLVE